MKPGSDDVEVESVSPVDDVADLYRREHSAMVRLARLIVGSAAIAEEVVHDAFVVVLERQGTIDDLGAYLRTVVVNNCRDVTRRSLTGRAKLARLTALEPSDSIVLPADLDETWRALDLVTSKQRTALVLRYYADLSVADIATHMGQRPGTIKSLIHRGLATLRKELST